MPLVHSVLHENVDDTKSASADASPAVHRRVSTSSDAGAHSLPKPVILVATRTDRLATHQAHLALEVFLINLCCTVPEIVNLNREISK